MILWGPPKGPGPLVENSRFSAPLTDHGYIWLIYSHIEPVHWKTRGIKYISCVSVGLHTRSDITYCYSVLCATCFTHIVVVLTSSDGLQTSSSFPSCNLERWGWRLVYNVLLLIPIPWHACIHARTCTHFPMGSTKRITARWSSLIT